MLAESRVYLELAAPVGFLAIHAGLENGTGDLALGAAARIGGSALWVRQQSNDRRLHVSSNAFLPEYFPALSAILDHCPMIVSLHGHDRSAFLQGVFVGGRDRGVAAVMSDCLRRHCPDLIVIDDLAVIPPELAGLGPQWGHSWRSRTCRIRIDRGRWPWTRGSTHSCSRGYPSSSP